LAGALVLIFILAASISPVYADNGIPALPHAFYGAVTINGSPAPTGTTIEVRGTNIRSGGEGNPITTSQTGRYGSADLSIPQLVAQGNIEEGTALSFYVNGIKATLPVHLPGVDAVNNTFPWAGGKLTELNLSATINYLPGSTTTSTTSTTTPSPTSTTVPPSTSTTPSISPLITIDLSDYIDATGKLTQDVIVSSADGRVRIEIKAGTIAQTASGAPLTRITVTQVDNPAGSTASNANFVTGGFFYDIAPTGARFSQSITLTLPYDPAKIPAGTSPYSAWWNTETRTWEPLPTVSIDPAHNTVTANAAHFTVFAVISARPASSITPTTPAVTQTLPPTSSPLATSTTPVTSPPPSTTVTGGNQGISAGVIIGIVIACAAVVLGIGLVVFRRRKK
jgi:hypothetical protein